MRLTSDQPTYILTFRNINSRMINNNNYNTIRSHFGRGIFGDETCLSFFKINFKSFSKVKLEWWLVPSIAYAK